MDAAIYTFLGAPDFPAVQSSVSQLLSNMGGASSRPPPPPRVAKTLPTTTVWVQHLPPIISETARQAILATAQLRNKYLAGGGGEGEGEGGGGGEEDAGPQAPSPLIVGRLDASIDAAREAANIRDFTVLVTEQTVLRLVTGTGSPSRSLLDLARAVNPFLNRHADDVVLDDDDDDDDDDDGHGTGGLPAPFRQSDLSLIDGPEKDLLVLLHYCDPSNLKNCPEEAVAQLSAMAAKHGTIKDLDLRKEPLSETEVYIHWVLLYLTANVAPPTGAPSPDLILAAKLDLVRSTQMSRLLTVCEMLLSDGRLDQMCFLLVFLRRCAAVQESRSWWRSRTKQILKGMRKRRAARARWHVDFADEALAGLKAWEHHGPDRPVGRSEDL
ncbi:hypothetical protein CTA2_9075 [Colletotrichum tanaceti]|uniref:Uncharacterized protein n=1 Tax=Colletotrichum tanaceti TaxID=1306861 RepID=A0A4U6X3L6_9PEZI|nr:hypothetical protein CTA2_9075 [Colletotrichum tanaceti]TKW49960.1 hypothetical protein CTA1_11195 [Colletotrichum tanaceti]